MHTPIFFDLRKEGKWDIPMVALPKPKKDIDRHYELMQLIRRGMISIEAARILYKDLLEW